MGIKKLQPLVALHHILQHCLPAYFQKCRYYGLHANACNKRITATIPDRIKNNKNTVRTIFQILKTLLGVEKISCDQCGHEYLDEQIVTADTKWIYTL